MGEWKQWSQTHVSHMEHGDFYHGEKSITLDAARDVKMELTTKSGKTVVLKSKVALKAGEIMRLKRSGDHLARQLWTRYVDRVARGLSVVVNTLDPDILVMGGGISNLDEIYGDLPPVLASYTFSPVFETPIRKAVHGDSSGVRGAAWLWKDA